MDVSARDSTLANLDIELADGRPAIILAHKTKDITASREYLAGHRDAILAALHRFGSVMIRGLAVSDTDDFAVVRNELLGGHLSYQERSTPRSELADGVYSSTDMPAVHPIRLHNESSYVVQFPGVLLFGCVTAPDKKGATTVGDSRAVLAHLDPGVVQRFRERGWALLRNYHPSLSVSWQRSFGTSDPAEVETYFREGLIAWHWGADDSLLTSQRRAAVLRHPETGDETWFNHVAFWNRHTLAPEMLEVLLASYGERGLPYETVYGDGEPVPADEIQHMNEVYDRVQRRESYRVGDLLLVDNLLSCHGREPYRGDRKILVAMGMARTTSECAAGDLPAPGPLPV